MKILILLTSLICISSFADFTHDLGEIHSSAVGKIVRAQAEERENVIARVFSHLDIESGAEFLERILSKRSFETVIEHENYCSRNDIKKIISEYRENELERLLVQLSNYVLFEDGVSMNLSFSFSTENSSLLNFKYIYFTVFISDEGELIVKKEKCTY